jgi:hypothetical protein
MLSFPPPIDLVKPNEMIASSHADGERFGHG